MSATLKKVQSGDALVIPPQTFDTFIAAAFDFRRRQAGITCAGKEAPAGPAGTAYEYEISHRKNLSKTPFYTG